ncbi:acyltransferase family protein [Microbacterium arabinogalactanolyticum]|uniref:acyltransferase family protein n=1 Tax=Microbacterium arabinogalactanolyticum TaxID=69365 RepID=UPI00404431E3
MQQAADESAIHTRSSFRGDIQGLRAIAVLAVFAAHATSLPAGGFIGVDIFFVISGFLITGLLIREFTRTGRISLVRFYKRRIRRLAPAAVATLAVTVAASAAIFYPARSEPIAVDGVWSFFFVSNWRFILQKTDYFAQDGPVSPLQHFWSLSVEEQFYLVWPVLLLVVMGAFVARRRWDRAKVAGTLIVSVVIVSFALGYVWPFTIPSVAYFNTVTRAWELGAGGLLAVFTPALSRMARRLRGVLAAVGIVLMVLGLLLITEDLPFPAPWAVVPVLGTALVIAAGAGASRPPLPLLSWRPIRYIGDISYSLYLWHFPALILGGALFAPFGAVATPMAVLLGFTLAVVSYHLIERPALSSPWLQSQPGWKAWWASFRTTRIRFGSAAAILALTVAAVGASSAVINKPGPAAAADTPLAQQLARAVKTPIVTDAVIASLNRGEDMTWSLGEGTPCLNQGLETSIAECHAGDGPRTALVIGDSFAAASFPAIADGLSANGYRSIGVMNSSCPVTTGRLDLPSRPQHELACDARSSDLQKIVALAAADLVVILDSETAYLALATNGNRVEEYREVRREAVELIKRKAQVLIVEANPRSHAAKECMTKLSAAASQCLGSPSAAWVEKSVADRQVTDELGVGYVHTLDLYCHERTCPVSVGEALQRIDTGHLTATYLDLITPELTTRIGKELTKLSSVR